MSTKHYNTTYLEGTAQFLKTLKEYSYNPFLSIDEGIVLDLGCGIGGDAIQMSALLNGGVKVVGVDHDPVMLEKAKAASAELSNVEFIISEAHTLPFENRSVAGVRSERMVQHLKEPENTFREIHRILQPDSPVLLLETDWEGLIFYNEHVEIGRKVVRYLTEEKVNNGFASRNLPSYLKAEGFRDIKIEVFPFILKSLKEANEYLWFELILEEAADKGFLTKEEWVTFKDALAEADQNNYFSCSINMIAASAIK